MPPHPKPGADVAFQAPIGAQLDHLELRQPRSGACWGFGVEDRTSSELPEVAAWEPQKGSEDRSGTSSGILATGMGWLLVHRQVEVKKGLRVPTWVFCTAPSTARIGDSTMRKGLSPPPRQPRKLLHISTRGEGPLCASPCVYIKQILSILGFQESGAPSSRLI